MILDKKYVVPRISNRNIVSYTYFRLYSVRINGIPACANKELLVDIVRNEWGFRGYISTDDDATIFEITKHHYYKTPEEVVAGSVKVVKSQHFQFERKKLKSLWLALLYVMRKKR